MAADNMRLRVVLDLVERVVAPLKRISTGSSDAAKSLKATRDRLKELNQQQAMVGDWRTMRTGLADTAAKLTEAQAKVAQLARTLHANGPPTRAMERDFARARREADSLGQQHERQAQQVQQLREKLRAAGISTRDMSTHERGLRQNIAATTAEIGRQNAALRTQADHQRKLAKLREQHAKAMVHTGMAVGTGFAMKHAGTSMAMGLTRPMAEGKHSANEELRIGALGLGDQATADAVKFAKGMKTYGTSMTENLGLMRDAITVFSDVHHAELVTPMLAKMKFANEAVFGSEDAAENEAKFMDMLKVIEMRGGLSSKEAFERQANIVQQVLTATGGRVGPTEWLNMIKTGGVAAKGLKDEAFYFQMEPLVQEMGGNRVGTAMMSAYQNIYQGKTTKRAARLLDTLGLIGDRSKVQEDKAGQISHLSVGALKGSELFRENQFEWMERVMLPALAEKGITEKQQVIDAIGGIFSNRTASGLFAQMYLQREQVHKNAALNARANNVDKLYDKAKGSAPGAEIELLKKRDDLYREFSTAVMPEYVKALEVITSAVKGLMGFMREYPMLTKVVGIGVGALAVGMTVLGAVLIPLALIAGKAMLVRFLFRWLLATFMGAPAATGAAAAGMGLLSRVATGLSMGFSLLRTGAVWLLSGLRVLAVFMIANPIVAALLLMATAAYMVWRNWDGIKGGLLAIWQQLSATAGAMWDQAAAGAAALWQTLLNAKNQFFQAGSDLMQGLVDGITSRAMAVRDAVAGMADAVGAWFREKLGIASPSRVFMQYGGWIAEGAAIGMQGGQGAVRTAALALATTATAAAPGMAGQGPVRFDSRPPLQAAAPQAPAPMAAGASYSITINPPPGMDPQAIARAVSAELDRRERAKRSRVLSQLSDID